MLDPTTPYVSNAEVARILFQVASLLEMTQDNVYRVRAYRRAAFGVLALSKSITAYYGADEEPPLPGVGTRIRGRLRELINTGSMGVYQTLLAEVGEPVATLLTLHGVGPRTATRLVEELGVGSLSELIDAARAGRIQRLRGFGPKREGNIRLEAEAHLDGVA